MSQYRELYEFPFLIKKLVDEIGNNGAILDDATSKAKLAGCLEKVAQLDREIDMDLKAINQLETEGSHDEDGESLEKRFKSIRSNILPEGTGRCQMLIEEQRKELLQMASREQEDEPEMEMISITYSDKDPISKKKIENPVKNSTCGHVYDRDSVEAYIRECRARKQLCQCPVRSCPNKRQLEMERMTPFPEFFDQLAKE